MNKVSAEQGKTPGGEITPGEGSIKKWFSEFMDLRDGMDREGAMKSITGGRLMRGSNAWMLVCSIMIASLGLNLNSGAVIIGAMLISPLMNPILGVGLGIGTNDRTLLWQALQNFGVAIAIALITSFIYFFFTPLDTFTDEMRARTEPTILDGLVAVFGGFAGIISVTRADKTNAIPGVAIATALMPPLCVSGYGLVLAIKMGAGLDVFWRSFYLFFLNSFFIAVTAYLIIRILRFPYKRYMNKADARRSQIIIGAISLLMIAPGVFILQEVLNKQRIEQAAAEFTRDYFPASLSTYLLDRQQVLNPKLIFPVVDRMLPEDSLRHYEQIAAGDPYRISNLKIVVDTSFSPTQISQIKGQLAGLEEINARLLTIETESAMQARERMILQQRLESFEMDSARFSRFSRQFLLAFPDVETIRLARAQSYGRVGPDDESRYVSELPLAALRYRLPPRRRSRQENQRTYDYLIGALGVDTIVIVDQ